MGEQSIEERSFDRAYLVRAQELLTALLMKPLENLAASVTNKDNLPSTCDITVADIIGPRPILKDTNAKAADSSDRARDANFSLLSYSFSLVSPDSNLE